MKCSSSRRRRRGVHRRRQRRHDRAEAKDICYCESEFGCAEEIDVRCCFLLSTTLNWDQNDVKAMPMAYVVRSLPSMTKNASLWWQTNEYALYTYTHTWDRALYMHIPRLGSSFAYIYLICLREMVIWWDSSAMRSSVVSFAREKGLQFSHENFCHRRCWCWCFCCRLLMVLSVCLMCVYAEHIATNLNIIYGLNGESFRLHMGDWALSRRHNDEQRIGNDCLHILHSSSYFQPFFSLLLHFHLEASRRIFVCIFHRWICLQWLLRWYI